MPDEVARIGALSNGSNGQRSLESASLHFEAIWRRERGNAERESPAEILSRAKDLLFRANSERELSNRNLVITRPVLKLMPPLQLAATQRQSFRNGLDAVSRLAAASSLQMV